MIGALLDDPLFCAIVDRSGWPVERAINLRSRVDFINQILIEELFDKRLSALNSFKEGLDHFGLLTLIARDPDQWKPMFSRQKGTGVYGNLSASDFLSMVQSTPKSDAEKNAYSNFVQFIKKAADLTGRLFIS